MDTKELWKIWHRLDVIIWGYKYELIEIPELDETLREILEDIKKELKRMDGEQ